MDSYVIISGREIKDEILDLLKDRVSKLSKKPSFVVIQVGDNDASDVYIKQKEKMANYIGYGYQHLKLPEDTDTDEIIELIDGLNNDDDVNGIIVQMPLPSKIDVDMVINSILPIKDIDGLTDVNAGLLFHNKDTLYSCTPFGIMEILKRYNISVLGKHVVIVGRSNLVGKPLSMMMTNAGATVTLCHSKTVDLARYTRDADILVSCVGKANFITGDMVRKDSVVIDVGITRLANGLCGDVLFDEVIKKVKYITPVPGGVGPMTVAMLGMNVLKAYEMQQDG